ncbi:MAG: DUF501 domain-containing protein [Propionibacteriaceae bacterium]|jgi:hypothetical protein|nr:DUF501 domain-containing protein [Propionibacteriaceae bacterium]
MIDSPHAGLSRDDAAIVAQQLGRDPRGAQTVAWRCPCGRPGVVMTAPRLPNGVPFPTTYYLTCTQATKACSSLEGAGVMAAMNRRLAQDQSLAQTYREAHRSYLADRDLLAAQLGQDVPEIAGVSAGGMPDRVKCLHALAAQSLAKGPGVNPLGDEVLAAIGEFWRRPCLSRSVPADAGSAKIDEAEATGDDTAAGGAAQQAAPRPSQGQS